MIAGDITEPVIEDRFGDFKISYPDFYYMNLEGEAAEPMKLEILNSAGEAVWSQEGTQIGGERIRLKLSKGEYYFLLTATSGYKVDYTLD